MTYPLVPLTVSQLNRHVRSWLEQGLGEICVLGELSNLSKPASGHYYFTLKDSGAQLRCVFFRNLHDNSSRLLRDGLDVLVSGKLSLYEARGDYQLMVHTLVPAGIGRLYQEYEYLKTKLQQQGLFNPERKKLLPLFPNTIAVITSASGAAIHDILTTLHQRYPIANVIIYPSDVQGQAAVKQLIKAIQQANLDKRADVILLARGGGSLEDLWPFNDEHLALAISASTIPIISGVGHETDTTIADFVADRRAATPTAAAQAATPDKHDLIKQILSLAQRLQQAMAATLQHQHYYLQQQLINLQLHNPQARRQQAQLQLNQLKQQLTQHLANKLNTYQQTLRQQLATLQAVSPLATLERGYAIATHHQSVLLNSERVKVNDMIELTLAKGTLTCTVIAKGAQHAG